METDSNWGMYLCSMGDHPAMVVFDDGIANHVDKLTLSNSIKVRLALQNVTENGMPTMQEGERLMIIGPIVEDIISDNGGVFLGRVTTNRLRWTMGLIDNNGELIVELLTAAALKHNFDFEVFVEADPQKAIYWEDLYPTADDRQVMLDMQVLNALLEAGDDQTRTRTIVHYAHFNSKSASLEFSDWLKENDYTHVEVSQARGESMFRSIFEIKFAHQGTTMLDDISHHSLKLSRKAKASGGEYDGWETSIEASF
jgi:Family of unknown function (DUF695)/Regulator of ribonuclease activity B